MKMYFHFAHMALVRRRKAPTLRQRTRKRCSGSCPRSKACAVRDNYPKTLLTLDDAREQSYDGIRRIYALDWLLGKVEA